MANRQKKNGAVEEPENTITLAEYLDKLDELFEEQKEWARSDPRFGYVYFVEADGYLKIGFATDVRGRMRGMQSGNPNKISLLDAFADENAQWLEKILHYFFEEHKHHGEWYDLSPEQIDEGVAKFEQWAQDMAKQVRSALACQATKLSLRSYTAATNNNKEGTMVNEN